MRRVVFFSLSFLLFFQGASQAFAGENGGASKAPFTIKSEVIERKSENGVAYRKDDKLWPVKEGQTLYGVLSEWGARNGWTVVWDSEYSYVIRASGVMHGETIGVAIKNLLISMGDINPKVLIKLYSGNKVILVTSGTRN